MTSDAGLRASRTACKTVEWDDIWCANPSVHSNSVPNKKLIHKQINQPKGGEGTVQNHKQWWVNGVDAAIIRVKYLASKLKEAHVQTTDAVTPAELQGFSSRCYGVVSVHSE